MAVRWQELSDIVSASQPRGCMFDPRLLVDSP